VFQKELYNIERLYKFIQRAYTLFWTVVLQQDTPNFVQDSYGSMWLLAVMQGVSEKSFTLVFQMLLSGECYENV
jgi:hypothetical protein